MRLPLNRIAVAGERFGLAPSVVGESYNVTEHAPCCKRCSRPGRSELCCYDDAGDTESISEAHSSLLPQSILVESSDTKNGEGTAASAKIRVLTLLRLASRDWTFTSHHFLYHHFL